ncbi:hypothetical protein EVAR_30572_1 [Eumeta japonica]|uniref:Uncharacterized protein n=1 Tax=Eumeta variegata TaxID=151549 RepID=A0A4C1VPC2_EUMVA|nr:hypothetical protein EVAR_30572_1 [Eumeta japonica]
MRYLRENSRSVLTITAIISENYYVRFLSAFSKIRRWSPLPMGGFFSQSRTFNTRNSRRVISALPASWEGIGYLMEKGSG